MTIETETVLQVLQHSLGVDQYGQGKQYRNHFVTGRGSSDWAACQQAVDDGLMTRRDGTMLTGGDFMFQVTPKGREFVLTNSPKPPKISRSAARYQRYLDADSSMSFGEWLKRKMYDYKPDWHGDDFDPWWRREMI